MSLPALRREYFSEFEQLRYAQDILRLESQALVKVLERLDGTFCEAVELLYNCQGSVLVTGMGKAGIIGQKLTATLASTGTRAHFLHPAEAIHGDLGRVHGDDVVLALSQSGETEELVRLLPSFRAAGTPVVAITASSKSALGRAAAIVLELGPLQEACQHGLAPSTSTTAMLGLGDALALVVSRQRGFRREDFARFHPGGSLGRKLAKVEDHMRPRHQCRLACDRMSVRDTLIEVSRPGRRTGAILLVDDTGRLSGLFTDSDLARLFEQRRDQALDGPISDVMTRSPTTVFVGALLIDAVAVLAERKISELPVVDEAGAPVGLIDVTDVVAFSPESIAR
jgi:arabinose-5-phosphate isomerase